MNTKPNNHDETSVGKYVSAQAGTILSEEYLETQFPHLTFLGKLHETGLLGIDKTTGDVVAFVRHPSWVPVLTDDGQTAYGGRQTAEHLTHILGRRFNKQAAQIAAHILHALQSDKPLPYGALKIGKEIETLAHQADGLLAEVPQEYQVELQRCLYEEALPPYNSLEESIHARCQSILRRKDSFPQLTLLDTSAPLTGSPNDPGMQLNNGTLASYVRPWAERLHATVTEEDQETVEVLNVVARQFGYNGYKDMVRQKGFPTIWPTAACQTSYGIAHIEENGEYRIPLEHSIAVADIFNSDMGSIAELLMLSGPLLFGKIGKIRLGGKEVWPRDYRMIIKYAVQGAWPAPFIHTPEELYKHWRLGALDGLLYTIDRLSFLGETPDHRPFAMIYGSAKIRVEVSDLRQMFGRVENTIAGASPSLLDEIAHDAFLYLLAIAALEATARGQSPLDYYGKRYPHLGNWRERKLLSRTFNFSGAKGDGIVALIDETIALLKEMDGKYPPLHNMITFTLQRIQNLRAAPMADLELYAHHPCGPISEVMQQMLSRGVPPLQLSRALEEYQYALAKKIAAFTTKDLFAKLIELAE